MKYKSVLVTGSAGFIGSNLVMSLIKESVNKNIIIVGFDNMNNYYDPSLKEYRLKKIDELIHQYPNVSYKLIKGDLSNKELLDSIFNEYKFDAVVNLAAQAGVRYSITNPDTYINSNVIGFYNVLECCRKYPVKHLVYASSSSVYGDNNKVPYSVKDNTDNPVSLYAATKKSNELLAYSYSKLYGIPCTGLRFFTVYGPCGRPDMAYFSFANKLVNEETIEIFNYGNCYRDFTYIDDVIIGINKVIDKAPETTTNNPPYALYNLGNSHPENLLNFVTILQEELINAGVLPKDYDFDSHKKLVPMQPGDVVETYADMTEFENNFNFKPTTSLRDGLRMFATWFMNYFAK